MTFEGYFIPTILQVNAILFQVLFGLCGKLCRLVIAGTLSDDFRLSFAKNIKFSVIFRRYGA